MVIRKIKYILYIIVVALSSCYNSFDSATTSAVPSDLYFNMTIERLHEQTASQDYFDVVSDVVIMGVVTANDEGGNFYQSFVIEQDGYGVEILEGLSYTYVRYQIGNVVMVNLKGLRISRNYGVMQIGVASSAGSYYDVDYLGHEYLVEQHITNSGVSDVVTPMQVTLEELYEDSQYEAMCGRLVSVEGVRFYSEAYDTGDMLWGGAKIFVDEVGWELGCYTSEYAYYSLLQIDEGYATMTGILEYGYINSTLVPYISMRTIDDYVLNDSEL